MQQTIHRLAYMVSLFSVDSQLLNCVFDNS